jgi:hypothetical protein
MAIFEGHCVGDCKQSLFRSTSREEPKTISPKYFKANDEKKEGNRNQRSKLDLMIRRQQVLHRDNLKA